MPVVAPPPIFEPASGYAVPAHMVAFVPALTVGTLFTVKTTVLKTAIQAPAGSSVVKVSVTVPPLAASGVNVTEAGLRVGEVVLS